MYSAPQQQTINFKEGLIRVISPEARSKVSILAKAATSKTAKDLAKTHREQAIDSALNMTKDLINGNDMRHPLDRVEIRNKDEVQANSKIYSFQNL